tara:strand:- start:921 stop:2570 length:1650 start_codon:yes stop_codon:yes gene_type:complete
MTNNSKVLALKYRPSLFDDLIGQQIVGETIFNSIKMKKIPNAYLFTGIRGVGKTTIARIVAKSLNCSNGIEKLCRENLCENCKAISTSNHIDVLEMDAASKTGVDDVRDLIEFSRYGPSSAKYKIFIIDEVHMLSKQAFNALLKTLEEPPEYLKFIFATTEVKKIPITVISRCQRFDLPRIKSIELFDYIKKIKEKEKGNISDEVIRLIVKISEGSVRDALSLLDRAMVTFSNNKELDIDTARNIFGYFDKGYIINLIKFILKGNETKVIGTYRSIYDKGIDPKNFLNDFLEILYYFKNIDSLMLEGNNFSINDNEFNEIKEISKNIDTKVLLNFWQFTLKTLEEIDLVSNQNLSVEMFLIRLIYLSDIARTDIENSDLKYSENKSIETNLNNQTKSKNINDKENNDKTISQIKNIFQEKKLKKPAEVKINSFEELIKFCIEKKELHLKYELETNVNLVSFKNQSIEIAFNDNLNKNFVKDLSLKLFEWTGLRWIIAFSQEKGNLSLKEVDKINKSKILATAEKSNLLKEIEEIFPDSELIDIELNKNN